MTKFLAIALLLKAIPFLLCFFFILTPNADANFYKNLRWTIDGSARLNLSNSGGNSYDNSSQIYALGLDSHKVLTRHNRDIGYAVAQVYFTTIRDLEPVPFLFNDKNDSQFIIREAHFNYTPNSLWLPNIRLGHFTLPFGLEESVDTNGRLLDYHLGENLGTKLDWGIDFNKVLHQLEYSVSYTLGGKNKLRSVDGSYAITARLNSLSHRDFVIGSSVFEGKIDGISRKRVAIDWRYYWHTYGLLGELSWGEDNQAKGQYQTEKYALLELNKTSTDSQLQFYTQFIFRDKAINTYAEKSLNMGLSYQINAQFEFSMSAMTQLDTPASVTTKQLARMQIRLRY